MRDRSRIVGNLEAIYTSAFRKAERENDRAEMDRLDFAFQRDQLYLETLLDIRDLLLPEAEGAVDKATSLIDKAKVIRRAVKLR